MDFSIWDSVDPAGRKASRFENYSGNSNKLLGSLHTAADQTDHWEPGRWGKAVVTPEQKVHAWSVSDQGPEDYYGDRIDHHYDRISDLYQKGLINDDGVTLLADIDPDGNVSHSGAYTRDKELPVPDGALESLLSYHPALKETLTGDNWTFGSYKDASVPVVHEHPKLEERAYLKSEPGEDWHGRIPLLWHKPTNAIHVGPPDSAHYGLVNHLGIETEDTRFGWVGYNKEAWDRDGLVGSETMGWYGSNLGDNDPSQFEKIPDEVKKAVADHFGMDPDTAPDDMSDWHFGSWQPPAKHWEPGDGPGKFIVTPSHKVFAWPGADELSDTLHHHVYAEMHPEIDHKEAIADLHTRSPQYTFGWLDPDGKIDGLLDAEHRDEHMALVEKHVKGTYVDENEGRWNFGSHRTESNCSSGPGWKDEWKPGETANYEYHCYEGHDSSDAHLWYRSHQPVTVVSIEESDESGDTMEERTDSGQVRVYRIRFADGFEATAWEDELLTDPQHWSRPDPPTPPTLGSHIRNASITLHVVENTYVPGENGRGLVFNDGTTHIWTGDVHHGAKIRELGKSRDDDVFTYLEIGPDYEVYNDSGVSRQAINPQLEQLGFKVHDASTVWHFGAGPLSDTNRTSVKETRKGILLHDGTEQWWDPAEGMSSHVEYLHKNNIHPDDVKDYMREYDDGDKEYLRQYYGDFWDKEYARQDWHFASDLPDPLPPWELGTHGKGLYHPDHGVVTWAKADAHHFRVLSELEWPVDNTEMFRVLPDGGVANYLHGEPTPEMLADMRKHDPRLKEYKDPREDWKFGSHLSSTVEPWVPGNRGKGFVVGGKAYAWKTDNSLKDGYPSHEDGMVAYGFDDNIFQVMDEWGFYYIEPDGTFESAGNPSTDGIMKAHLGGPWCAGCGASIAPDEEGNYSCPTCHWTGVYGENNDEGSDASDWHFGAMEPPEFVHTKMDVEDSEYSNWLNHDEHAVIYDPGDHRIYVGKPRIHHDDLANEFDLHNRQELYMGDVVPNGTFVEHYADWPPEARQHVLDYFEAHKRADDDEWGWHFGSQLSPWTPGSCGKYLVTPEGEAHHWVVPERDGLPSHMDYLEARGIPVEQWRGWQFGLITPEGELLHERSNVPSEEVLKAIPGTFTEERNREDAWKFASDLKSRASWELGIYGKGIYHPDHGVTTWNQNAGHHFAVMREEGIPWEPGTTQLFRIEPDGGVLGWSEAEIDEDILATLQQHDPRFKQYENKDEWHFGSRIASNLNFRYIHGKNDGSTEEGGPFEYEDDHSMIVHPETNTVMMGDESVHHADLFEHATGGRMKGDSEWQPAAAYKGQFEVYGDPLLPIWDDVYNHFNTQHKALYGEDSNLSRSLDNSWSFG